MMIIHAVYENGVFRPTEPVDLAQSAHVKLEVHPIQAVDKVPKTDHLDEIYEILSRSYETGDPYLASRHNEHQP
jgi:predicted DNA-binding antitoxin AbrB/MazE fold protein